MNLKVRYLICLAGAAGALPRYFWQPGPQLRAAGWRPERVPLDFAGYNDPDALHAAAIARAQALNAEVDAARLASAAPPAAERRDLAALIADYKAGKRYLSRQPATKRGYLQNIKLLETWAGDVPVRSISARSIATFHEALSRTPARANAAVVMLRLLLSHAVRLGWITHNPAQKFGLEAPAPSGIIWPVGAVELFVATADAMKMPSMGTAVLLNAWLGQREGDILRLPRAAIRAGDTLVIRQNKTKAAGSLPLGMVPALKARLDAELARHQAREAKPGALPALNLVVNENTGLPYKPDNFRHAFARVRAKLAETTPSFPIDYLMPGRDMTDENAFIVRAEDLTFMALRHTAVTRLAEAGCDVAEISAITLHSLATAQQVLKRYMVRTAQLARGAFQKRLDAEAPPPAKGDQKEVG